MTKLFKKLFIKNYQNTSDPKVRTAYGVASGILGIIANSLLFALKLVAGILSNSIAVIADAVNNLSDFTTSIITLCGFKISGKPADKEHPYGHERMEYITGLIMACVILFIGVEAGRTAIDKILSGGSTDFSIITCIILGFSILVKLVLYFIYKGLSKSIDSDAIGAMSIDSRNDVVSTFVIFICVLVSLIFGVSLDGYLGVIVALFIIISAIKMIKETIDPLVGVSPDKELIDKIKNKLKSYPDILDIHDLIVHNYGPTKTFASVHIEVDSSVNIMISHDLADNVERDFMKDMNILMVCHLDPVDVNDTETLELKDQLSCTLKLYNPEVCLHDFRVVKGHSHTNVIFDVVIPYNLSNAENDIRQIVDEKLTTYSTKYFAVIEFEKDFNN